MISFSLIELLLVTALVAASDDCFQPCGNGGQVIVSVNTFTCSCSSPYYGTRCELTCPAGFTAGTTATSSRIVGCYQLVTTTQTFVQSQAACQALDANGQLAVIDNSDKTDAIKTYLTNSATKCNVAYHALARAIDRDCTSPFVWKPKAGVSIPVQYTDWHTGEPNCAGGTQACGTFWWSNYGVSNWDDNFCDIQACALCEVPVF